LRDKDDALFKHNETKPAGLIYFILKKSPLRLISQGAYFLLKGYLFGVFALDAHVVERLRQEYDGDEHEDDGKHRVERAAELDRDLDSQ
jgi:hypothetical protein